MSYHEVRHLLREGDYVRTEFRCTAPENAPCRTACLRCYKACEEQCRCEYGVPIRTPEMGDVGTCMVIPWLAEDAPEECYNGDDEAPVRGPGWQAITPEWNGDNYSWDYAESSGEVIDVAYINRQRAWSEATFGPYPRVHGVVDHIRKELVEVVDSGNDLSEWVDVIMLAFDGACGTGASSQEIIDALKVKLEVNRARTWPDWRTADRSKAIEHVRS